MGNKVTMQEIADQLGVTKVSVSKAINAQPGISADLRERILAKAKQMGYVKLTRGGSPVSHRFAWVCPKRFFLEDETFYSTIYYYLNRRCINLGYSLTCFVVNDREELAGELPSQLLADPFDGLFIAGEFRDSFLAPLERLDAARVAIDFYHLGMEMDSVVVDNYFTGLEVASYLIRKGHREIGFVGSIHHTSSVCDRYFGYRKALALNGLPFREDWHIVNDDLVTGLYTMDFTLPEELPTAFVCHCDKAAFTLMQKLDVCGVKVPEQVSLVSFDNTSLATLVTPQLSSVDIDRRQIAHHSLNLMLERIAAPGSPPKKIYLSAKLVERDSVTGGAAPSP